MNKNNPFSLGLSLDTHQSHLQSLIHLVWEVFSKTLYYCSECMFYNQFIPVWFTFYNHKNFMSVKNAITAYKMYLLDFGTICDEIHEHQFNLALCSY